MTVVIVGLAGILLPILPGLLLVLAGIAVWAVHSNSKGAWQTLAGIAISEAVAFGSRSLRDPGGPYQHDHGVGHELRWIHQPNR